MARRPYWDALMIQLEGACNPFGVVHSIMDRMEVIRNDEKFAGTNMVLTDPSLRAMVHQLGHLFNLPEFEENYSQQMQHIACQAALEYVINTEAHGNDINTHEVYNEVCRLLSYGYVSIDTIIEDGEGPGPRGGLDLTDGQRAYLLKAIRTVRYSL